MKSKKFQISRCVPLPKGYKSVICPICGGTHLIGTLNSEFADEQDPNIICKDCGYLVGD